MGPRNGGTKERYGEGIEMGTRERFGEGIEMGPRSGGT
jgi:hypothetical protein